MVIAMLLGGAVYDPVFMGRLLAASASIFIHAGLTLRFPVYLTLFTALLTLWTALVGLREPKRTPLTSRRKIKICDPEPTACASRRQGGQMDRENAGALLSSSRASSRQCRATLPHFFQLLFSRDSVPEASLRRHRGDLMGGIGFVVSPLARRIGDAAFAAVELRSHCRSCPGRSDRRRHPLEVWGVIFIVPVACGIMIIGYLVSYYLNAIVDSSHRATVLSFKGVAFNLGYGFISLVFALVLRALRDGGNAQDAVARSLISPRGFSLAP